MDLQEKILEDDPRAGVTIHSGGFGASHPCRSVVECSGPGLCASEGSVGYGDNGIDEQTEERTTSESSSHLMDRG